MNTLLLIVTLLQAAGSVRGIVTNDAGDALSGARIELSSGRSSSFVLRTEPDGQFAFTNLTPGTYHFSVKKEGYVRHLGEVTTTDASRIVIRLQPAAIIEGEVRNEDEVPVANILVQALRRSYNVRGDRTLSVFSSTLTDDRGIYRLYWVDPGDYYINASYLPKLPTPVNLAPDLYRAAYAPTYHPGTNDPSEAQLVHLESGQGRTINFKLQRSPLVTVQGTVYSVIEGGTTRADVTLTSLSDVGGTVRYTTKTDSKGVFEMSGISAGTYVLSAKSSSRDGQIGYSRIEVLDIDRPRADVVIGRGVDVSVRFSAEVPQALDLRGAQVSLVPLEPYLARPSNGSTPSVLVNVQPGPYLLDVAALPGNSYVRSARSAGYDVLEQALNVQYNTAALVEIELAVDGGQIAGIVADGGESTVVLIPDASRRHRPDQYRIAKSTAEGRFSINGVPPGDYRLFAWRSVETNAWLNSEFMLTNEQFGTNISVSPNSRASVQVRSIARSQ